VTAQSNEQGYARLTADHRQLYPALADRRRSGARCGCCYCASLLGQIVGTVDFSCYRCLLEALVETFE